MALITSFILFSARQEFTFLTSLLTLLASTAHSQNSTVVTTDLVGKIICTDMDSDFISEGIIFSKLIFSMDPVQQCAAQIFGHLQHFNWTNLCCEMKNETLACDYYLVLF